MMKFNYNFTRFCSFLLLPFSVLILQACSEAEEAPVVRVARSLTITPAPAAQTALAPIRVSGSYWIELSPVITAASSFYPEFLPTGEGGITRITSGEADIATNAETQLLRESLVNPDLRIIATVTAFTIAHSITLAGATLGLVHMPGPPIEAAIALSIAFVASTVK